MIKRPLVWILCAYLVGMYLAWQGLPLIITSILIAVLGLFIYLLMYRIKNKYISRRDKFLWSLPILMLLGIFSLKGQLTEPKLNEAFEQEANGELKGSISMIVKKQWGKVIYVKDNSVSLSEGNSYLCENVIIFCYDNSKGYQKQDISLTKNYLVGNQITVCGTLQKFSEPANQGQFNEKLYYQIENIDFKMTADQIAVTNADYSRFHYYLDQFKNELLNVYESILSDKESGTMIAMLLGEKYLLDEEIKQLYQINGISHVLAISGLHISLIGMFVFFVLRKMKLPIIPATLLAIFMIYSYGVLTNFSVSTNRAVVMMTVMLASGVIGKTYDMLSSLSLSALIVLLQNPLQILSAGFLLSFGAVLGLSVIYPCLQKLFPTKNSIQSSLYISVSAQVTSTPFVIYFFYQFPTYSILTNLIILPFVTILTLTSIIAGIAGAIFQPLGIFLIGGANYILKFYEWICRLGSRLPYNLITVAKPNLFRMLVYAFLLVLFMWVVRRFEKKYSIVILAIALLVLILPGQNRGLEVTMIDVGQGDAIFMESKSGTTYLMDGGSSDVKKVGINRIQPFLLSQGVDQLDYAIMSHSDSDHISGLMELLETGRINIRNLVLPRIKNKDDAYLQLVTLAQEKNIAIQYINTGDFIKDGNLQLLCLHPSGDYEPDSTNSYSTVLSVSYGEFDMLLTGDLQIDGEELVMGILTNRSKWMEHIGSSKEFVPITDYDILKVAHHGSKYSSCMEFLNLIKPEISLISSGKDNSYGHPHQELLTRLEILKSAIRITYNTGAIMIKTDGNRMEVRGFRK